MIRGSKQDKSRLVPMHATAVEHLAAYQQRRDQLCPRPATTAFFLSGAGTRLNSTTASKAFTRILKVAAITGATGATRPRLYDLRHTFAVTTMTSWYAAGADVAHLLPPTATRSACCCATPSSELADRLRHWTSLTSARPSSAVSWTPWLTTGTTASPPATPARPRATACAT